MLLAVPVVAAILTALVCGGSLRNLATLPVRGSGLILAGLAIEVLVFLPTVRDSALVLHWSGTIYIAALVLVLLGARRNWHLGLPARLALIGMALNVMVIVVNGGHMPVNAAAMRAVQGDAKVGELAGHHLYENTQLANSSSRLVLLSDRLPISLPGGRGNVYSAGDVLLAIGVSALAYRATRKPWQRDAADGPAMSHADTASTHVS
jgi:uncharacterized protein DUF5317